MDSYHEIWLSDAAGNRLHMLDDLLDAELVRKVNDAGAFTVGLPQNFDFGLLKKDYLVEFWHGWGPGELRCLGVGKIRKRRIVQDESGLVRIEIGGPDFLDTLDARIVAYDAGSAEAEKTDYADDMMKAIVRENLGSLATDTTRDLTSLGLSVAADVSLGPSLSKAFSRKNVLATLKDLAAAAAQDGTAVYFDLVPQFLSTGKIGWLFDTYINQPGLDRTASSNKPALFGDTWGNLAEPELEYDDADEINFVYVGGQGQGDARTIETASDTARIADSIWNRREAFIDARNEATTAILQSKAKAELYKQAGKVRFAGELLSTPSSRYGVDWGFGDRVTAEFHGLQFDGLIQAVKYSLASDGRETIDAKIEVDV